MKKTLTALAFAIVLMFGTTFANAGIIIAGAPAQDSGNQCTESDRSGIIIAGVAGIIIAGVTGTGIIIAGLTDDSNPADCSGILISD
jgi:hypothetical protein